MEEDIRKTAEQLLNRLKEESKPKNIYEFETVVPNYILLPLKASTEELINKNKELEEQIEEYKKAMAMISEICVDESKCHITSKEAVEEIRKNIIWKAKGE